MDQRRSGPLPNDSLSGFPLASGRPTGPVPARICVRGYGEAPDVVSSSQLPGAGPGGSEVLQRGAPSLARSRADRHPGDPPGAGDVLVCAESESLLPLRMLLVGDNLTGHYSVEVVRGLFAHGIMPLYTPRGGSGLNMASIRRRRRRSSPGWRRQPVAGIGSPGHSSGAANARPDEHGLARAARVSVAQVPGRGDRSPDQGRPEPMGVSKPTDPLNGYTLIDRENRLARLRVHGDHLERPSVRSRPQWCVRRAT